MTYSELSVDYNYTRDWRETSMRSGFQIRKLRILLLFLLLSVSVMGVSYSLYTARTDIRSSLTMGSMGVIFTDVYPEEGSLSGSFMAAADIGCGGKNIEIKLDGAHPGDSVSFIYTLQNNGTVPIVYELAGGSGLLKVYMQSDRLEAQGGTGMGVIRICVGEDMELGKSYDLSVVLNFRQVNAVKWQI